MISYLNPINLNSFFLTLTNGIGQEKTVSIDDYDKYTAFLFYSELSVKNKLKNLLEHI